MKHTCRTYLENCGMTNVFTNNLSNSRRKNISLSAFCQWNWTQCKQIPILLQTNDQTQEFPVLGTALIQHGVRGEGFVLFLNWSCHKICSNMTPWSHFDVLHVHWLECASICPLEVARIWHTLNTTRTWRSKCGLLPWQLGLNSRRLETRWGSPICAQVRCGDPTTPDKAATAWFRFLLFSVVGFSPWGTMQWKTIWISFWMMATQHACAVIIPTVHMHRQLCKQLLWEFYRQSSSFIQFSVKWFLMICQYHSILKGFHCKIALSADTRKNPSNTLLQNCPGHKALICHIK